MKEFFKPNPYFNTIWSNRDKEFYWTGCKDGMVIGAIGAISLIGFAIFVVPDWIGNRKNEEEQ